MSIPDKNIKNGCTSAEKQTKMFFGTKTVCVADRQYLCRRQKDAFLGKTISALWKENILSLQDYNLELEDIIHDLCGLVGGAMDLTTPRCQVQFPLPLFTPSQWRRFGIPSGGFLPTKIRLFMTTSQWRRFGIPSGGFLPTKIPVSYTHLTLPTILRV